MPDQSILWVDAGGGVTELLDGADAFTWPGVQGRMAPRTRVVAETVPLQPGQRFRDIQDAPLEVVLPVEFYAATDTALRTVERAWTHRLDPTRGDGRLRVTAPGGDQRELVCRCIEGMDRAVEDETDLGHRLRVALHFVTGLLYPYWQDAGWTLQFWQLLGSLATFFPLFPLRLSGSEIFAATTIDNSAGDVPAWPIWTIGGPGSNPVLRNLTSGKLTSIAAVLQAGEGITIDTSPGVKTVTKQDGTNLFGALSATSSLWPLVQGSNSLSLELTGALAGISTFQLSWKRGYRSP